MLELKDARLPEGIAVVVGAPEAPRIRKPRAVVVAVVVVVVVIVVVILVVVVVFVGMMMVVAKVVLQPREAVRHYLGAARLLPGMTAVPECDVFFLRCGHG